MKTHLTFHEESNYFVPVLSQSVAAVVFALAAFRFSLSNNWEGTFVCLMAGAFCVIGALGFYFFYHRGKPEKNKGLKVAAKNENRARVIKH